MAKDTKSTCYRKLTRREDDLLWIVGEDLAASVFRVPKVTLDLWREELGLPSVTIYGWRFYRYWDTQDWIRDNIDAIYLKTPPHLLPQVVAGRTVYPASLDREVLMPKNPELRAIVQERCRRGGIRDRGVR